MMVDLKRIGGNMVPYDLDSSSSGLHSLNRQLAGAMRLDSVVADQMSIHHPNTLFLSVFT